MEHSLFALYTRSLRRDLLEDGLRRQVVPPVWRYLGERESFSTILYAELDRMSPAQLKSIVDREVAFFSGIGHTLEWKLFYEGDDPGVLLPILRERGFSIEEPEEIMVLATGNLPAAVRRMENAGRRASRHSPCVPGGVLRPRRVTDPDEIQAAYTAVHGEAGDTGTALAAELAARMRAAPDSISIFVIEDGSQPVSVGWTLYFRQLTGELSPFAGLYGGATLSDYRRRGLYTSLVAARAHEAAARGVPYLTVDAGPESGPILEQIGFRSIARTRPAVFQPQGSPPSW